MFGRVEIGIEIAFDIKIEVEVEVKFGRERRRGAVVIDDCIEDAVQ